MTTARIFGIAGTAGMFGLFGTALGAVPVETGLKLCALCPLLFVAGSLSALWNTRR